MGLPKADRVSDGLALRSVLCSVDVGAAYTGGIVWEAAVVECVAVWG